MLLAQQLVSLIIKISFSDNGDIETLASDLIEVMLNRPLQGQQNSLEVGKAVKRQEELLNATLERSLGK